MILNEFFNLPQVFEKDMAENSPTDPKSWMASIQQEHPDVRFVQAKMPGAPIVALVDGKPSVAEDAEQTPFGSVTTTNAPVKPTQYHYGTEPSESEIRKKRLQDIRQRKQDLLRDFAQLGTLRTEMIYGLNNDVFLNKEQLLDYFDNLVDDPNLTALEYAHENGIPVSGLLKAIMSRATQLGISALDVRKLFNSAKAKQGVPEGMFGSRPSPVLPIVAKIDRVARELNPQNVETGKQIIQSHTRDITRMLSPQAKAGVDVIEQGMAEATGDEKFDNMMSQMQREPKYPDSQMPPTDVKDLYQWAVKNNKPYHKIFATWANREGYKSVAPALQRAGNLDTEALDYWTPDVWKIYWGELNGIDSEMPPEWAKKRVPDELRDYLDTVFDAYDRIVFDWPTEYRQIGGQGMAEAKDDYVPPREANYDDKYQAMVKRVGEKAKQQEKARQQQQPKAPVRESRLALLKQIIQS